MKSTQKFNTIRKVVRERRVDGKFRRVFGLFQIDSREVWTEREVMNQVWLQLQIFSDVIGQPLRAIWGTFVGIHWFDFIVQVTQPKNYETVNIRRKTKCLFSQHTCANKDGLQELPSCFGGQKYWQLLWKLPRFWTEHGLCCSSVSVYSSTRNISWLCLVWFGF